MFRSCFDPPTFIKAASSETKVDMRLKYVLQFDRSDELYKCHGFLLLILQSFDWLGSFPAGIVASHSFHCSITVRFCPVCIYYIVS